MYRVKVISSRKLLKCIWFDLIWSWVDLNCLTLHDAFAAFKSLIDRDTNAVGAL